MPRRFIPLPFGCPGLPASCSCSLPLRYAPLRGIMPGGGGIPGGGMPGGGIPRGGIPGGGIPGGSIPGGGIP